MSEDGGLSESLNMYMDTTESAPALVPKDVTEDLGLPINKDLDFVFIHKTAGYENVLYVSESALKYMVDGKETIITHLQSGDTISDISSIGNSVIVRGKLSTYYLLYKEAVYISLGTQIPFPELQIQRGDISFSKIEFEQSDIPKWDVSGAGLLNEFNNNKNPGSIRYKLSEQVLKTYKTQISECLKCGEFSTMRFVRYAVELFDGTLISSIPFLIGEFPNLLSKEVENPSDMDDPGSMTNTLTVYTYSVNIKMPDINFFNNWEHIVKSVNIYLSPPIIPDPISKDEPEAWIKATGRTQYKTEIPGYEGVQLTTNMTFDLGSLFANDEVIMFYASQCKLVKQIEVFVTDTFRKEEFSEDYKELCSSKGVSLKGSQEFNTEEILQKDQLKDDDIQHYASLGESYSSYNNRLLSISPVDKLSYMYSKVPDCNATSEESTLLLQFHLLTDSGEKVVEKRVSTGRKYFFFPDTRCYKVDVFFNKGDITKKLSYDMKTFAFLEGAYYLDKEFLLGGDISLSHDESKAIEGTPSVAQFLDYRSNYFYMSEPDNLFTFPDHAKYQFQSKVLGVAIATNAMSQGQFGQFPLYVFTEDGIWVMETGAEGTFVSQKPLSREVCINPDSICSIDNAVVFVTSKAVMMIQGSQVVDLSLRMTGRHYTPNDSALNIIRKKEGFSEFELAISEDDPFMKFMGRAKVAYDYVGKRLIFISTIEDGVPYKFQYIYKIDTQTWHKLATSSYDMTHPLNSYPECNALAQTDALGRAISLDINFGEVNASEFLEDFTMRVYDEPWIEHVTDEMIKGFVYGQTYIPEKDFLGTNNMWEFLNGYNGIKYTVKSKMIPVGKKNIVLSLSTVLDASTTQDTAKGILITRPFDLGMPDVFKSIKSIKIRGDYDKGNVNYILQGSDDGKTFYTMSSLRGKSWKMFRIFILADLEPTERISWIDIDFEPRYNNRLR
jgi:hypothetical protein